MQAKLKELGRILGAENLLADDASRIAYGRAAAFAARQSAPVLPLAIARPRHCGHVAELLRFCARAGIRLAIRGGGTAPLANAEARQADTLILLTTGLDRILDLDAENRIVRLQAGVSCARLAEEAGRSGLFYPPMPWSAQLATIGGNLAMNVAGSSSVKYGPAASFLLSLDAFASNGERIHCYSANATPGKLDPGLPLANLFCGSAGCLAFLAEARLRLLPLPAAWETRVFRFADAGAGQAAAEIMAERLLPAALEIFDPACAPLLGAPADCWLLHMEFCGSREATVESMARANAICARCDGEADAALAGQLHARRAELLPALARRGTFALEALSMPPARLPVFLAKAAEIAKNAGVQLALFGHAGIATIYIAFYGDSAAARQELFSCELMLNEQLGSEADAASARAQWQANTANIARVSASLRPVFDPAGLLAANPLPGAAQ